MFADARKDGRAKTAESLGVNVDQVPRNHIALAVNSQGGRSQDRLHIHADRLDPELGKQLKEQFDEGKIGTDHWSNLKPINGGHQYRAAWVEGADLSKNPIQIVHDQLAAEHGEEYARTHMGQHTIAVVAETDANGKPGFLVIDGRYGSDPHPPQRPPRQRLRRRVAHRPRQHYPLIPPSSQGHRGKPLPPFGIVPIPDVLLNGGIVVEATRNTRVGIIVVIVIIHPQMAEDNRSAVTVP